MRQLLFGRQPDDDDEYQDYPEYNGGETYEAQYDFDEGDIEPETEPPAYEPPETYQLAVGTIKDIIKECRTNWAFFRFNDGRRLWVYVTKLKRGDVQGKYGPKDRNGKRKKIAFTAESVQSVQCSARDGSPCNKRYKK